MKTITVHTQAELDTAVLEHGTDRTIEILIDSDPGIELLIASEPTAGRLVVGSASVVRVGGSARVDWVGGSARVDWVGGSARVGRAAGTSTVHLYAGGTLTEAGRYVAVFLHHKRVTVAGGHLIDVSDLDEHDPRDWADLTGTHIDEHGLAHLYKAVDDELRSAQRFAYPIGQTVTDPQWRDNNSCGGGLHLCPTPHQAKAHYSGATRFLEITVPLDTLRPIDKTKAKAPTVTVLREVDLAGDPVTVDAQERP
jgi:hypothetical protein